MVKENIHFKVIIKVISFSWVILKKSICSFYFHILNISKFKNFFITFKIIQQKKSLKKVNDHISCHLWIKFITKEIVVHLLFSF